MTTDGTRAPASADLPTDTYEDRVLACLLGTLAGDAYGVLRHGGSTPAGVPEEPTAGSISAATQLTLSTVDGLVEALEWANDGVAADETACLWLAYLRWLIRQGGHLPPEAPAPPLRWLDRQEELLPMTLPDIDTVNALSTGSMGTQARPLNPRSEGPGALMRSAPFGLVPRIPAGMVERLTVDAAALTHGSPVAKDTAALFSGLIRRLAIEGLPLDEALDAIGSSPAPGDPGPAPGAEGSSTMSEAPTATATFAAAIAAVRAGMAGSPSAAEQLAAALAHVVDTPRPGSSPVVAASIVGGIIGAHHGTVALPASYLTAPGVPAAVRTLARTLLSATTGS